MPLLKQKGEKEALLPRPRSPTVYPSYAQGGNMDEALRLCWRRYRTWAATARALKKSDDSWKRAVLMLTIVGTVAGTLGPFSRVTSWSAAAAGYVGAAALA